jgi:hypothetical protein
MNAGPDAGLERPASAPACFAAATVFARDSSVCRGCPEFETCANASRQTLEKIRGAVDIEALLRRHDALRRKTRATAASRAAPLVEKKEIEPQKVALRFSVDKKTDDVILVLPVQPKQIAIRLCSREHLRAVVQALAEGRNAFTDADAAFLRVAVDLLLAGGFTRARLRGEFVTRLGWRESTAASHVQIAVSILKAFRLVQETSEGHIVVIPGKSS